MYLVELPVLWYTTRLEWGCLSTIESQHIKMFYKSSSTGVMLWAYRKKLTWTFDPSLKVIFYYLDDDTSRRLIFLERSLLTWHRVFACVQCCDCKCSVSNDISYHSIFSDTPLLPRCCFPSPTKEMSSCSYSITLLSHYLPPHLSTSCLWISTLPISA